MAVSIGSAKGLAYILSDKTGMNIRVTDYRSRAPKGCLSVCVTVGEQPHFVSSVRDAYNFLEGIEYFVMQKEKVTA